MPSAYRQYVLDLPAVGTWASASLSFTLYWIFAFLYCSTHVLHRGWSPRDVTSDTCSIGRPVRCKGSSWKPSHQRSSAGKFYSAIGTGGAALGQQEVCAACPPSSVLRRSLFETSTHYNVGAAVARLIYPCACLAGALSAPWRCGSLTSGALPWFSDFQNLQTKLVRHAGKTL